MPRLMLRHTYVAICLVVYACYATDVATVAARYMLMPFYF